MNVDPIARLYRWIEYAAFGRSLERCRFAFLDTVAARQRVLILGEGDGRYLAQILTLNPRAQIIVIEASARMTSQARHRIQHAADRVSFIQADALNTDLPVDTFDAVVTNFFLDCFSSEEAHRLITRVIASLKTGGVWIVSEFQKPETGLARVHASVWLWTMYLFFRLTTGLRVRELPPYSALLKGEGLQLVSEQRRRFGLMVSQVWSRPPVP
jgi:ubiquinone/menaquinone biosynthesis C-methylase UbiE